MVGYAGGAYRIGWDTGNGAAGPVIEKLVKLLPGEHHTIFTQVDGHFPNHHPDPTEEKNLADLKRLVADKSLDFGLAFDGDGARIGAIDGQGRVIWGDQLLSILAEPVLREMPGARSEERRVGREWVSTGKSRCALVNEQKHKREV